MKGYDKGARIYFTLGESSAVGYEKYLEILTLATKNKKKNFNCVGGSIKFSGVMISHISILYEEMREILDRYGNIEIRIRLL